jgi:hypothetical protein
MSKHQFYADLSEIIGNMRSQANRDDIEVVNEHHGFTLEAMDQYADQIEKLMQAEVASDEGVAGTHAYDMLAVAAEREASTTEALIHMVAGTVLMLGIEKRIDFHGGASSERTVSFSPADMDAMHKGYELTANHDGLLTVLHIKPRAAPALGLAAEPGVDDAPAKPQAAEHIYNRPYWFARIGPERIAADDRDDAERLVRKSLALDSTIVAEVENRQCPRAECPNPDNQGMCAACSTI